MGQSMAIKIQAAPGEVDTTVSPVGLAVGCFRTVQRFALLARIGAALRRGGVVGAG